MSASDWVDGRSMVVGDQGALVGCADLPVPPDAAGQGEQPLADPDPDTSQGPATVAFQPKLVFERVEGALDPLPDPTQRPHPARLVSTVRTQQPGPIAGDQALELPASEALVAQDEQPRPQPRVFVIQQGRHDLALAQLRCGQAPGDRQPVRGGQQVQPEAPAVAVVAFAVAVAGMAGQGRTLDRLARGRAWHRGGVDQPQLIPPARGVRGEVLDGEG